MSQNNGYSYKYNQYGFNNNVDHHIPVLETELSLFESEIFKLHSPNKSYGKEERR